MAYEKQTWTTGEVITQEKLNHMEDGIANAGGDAGYECVEESTVLFDDEVTTGGDSPYGKEGSISYDQLITAAL